MVIWSVKQPRRITIVAIFFEGALALIALVVGWLLGHYPQSLVTQFGTSGSHWLAGLAWGVAATVPMLAGLLLIEILPLEPLRRLDAVVQRRLVPLFRGASLVELGLVASMAGLGEELLFRGLLQDGLAQWLGGPAGEWIAIGMASLLFGICHWVSRTYAALATLVGIYLGCVWLATGNLLAPIVAHALYDFVALVYLVRFRSN